MDEVENQINDLKHKEAKNSHTEQQEKKKKNKENDQVSINSLWDNFKRSNLHLIGLPEGEEKEQEIGNLSEKIVKENFPNGVKEIEVQVQEGQRVPIMKDAEKPTPRHIIIKRTKVKDKERLLKAREKKLVTGRLPDERGEGENGRRGEGIKKYKQVVTEQPWGYRVQYRKWSSQRTCTHDPWT